MNPDRSAALSLRWFDLNEEGEVRVHADCADYDFEAQAIVEKIVTDHAGRAGWLQVQPNIKEHVYLLYIADIEAEYEEVKKGLQWTDFRRMNDMDARRKLINCLRRWVIAYRAYPERGQVFLGLCKQELLGTGLYRWLRHDPNELKTHPDSLALGYDALAELSAIHKLSAGSENDGEEEQLRKVIAENLFRKTILPDYERIKPGNEAQRPDAVRLLREALSNYRLYPDEQYLDFLFRELTEEVKFCWIDINDDGREKPFTITNGFDPLAVLRGLHQTNRVRYRLYQARERIAGHRFANQLERYFMEISEFRHENRRPEREVAIDILRKIKGVYKYFPKQEFLELPLRELGGNGRIRWHALLLGVFPLTENHFENRYYGFEYKFERFEVRRLLENNYEETQRVLRETGEL